MSQTKIRCAIYTRKSSDEGLDQEFNSLDAQHEACEAYIASQKHEGWKMMPARYDDGGISGGTLDLGGGAINYASTYNLLSGFASGSVADLTFTNFDSFHFAPSLSNSGVLSFSEVPEPASAIAGVAVLAGMLRRRRAVL